MPKPTFDPLLTKTLIKFSGVELHRYFVCLFFVLFVYCPLPGGLSPMCLPLPFKSYPFLLHSELCCLDFIWHQCTDIGCQGGVSSKEPASQCKRHKRHGFDPLVGRIPWRRGWQPSSLVLPGESHRQRSLARNSPKVCKELDMTEAN